MVIIQILPVICLQNVSVYEQVIVLYIANAANTLISKSCGMTRHDKNLVTGCAYRFPSDQWVKMYIAYHLFIYFE